MNSTTPCRSNGSMKRSSNPPNQHRLNPRVQCRFHLLLLQSTPIINSIRKSMFLLNQEEPHFLESHLENIMPAPPLHLSLIRALGTVDGVQYRILTESDLGSQPRSHHPYTTKTTQQHARRKRRVWSINSW